MAITESQNYGVHPNKMAVGSFSDDAASPAAYTVKVGFGPRYVRMMNETTGQMMEWLYGMGDADAIQTVIAGTRSKITTGGITVDGDDITFPAPAQNDVVRFVAFG